MSYEVDFTEDLHEQKENIDTDLIKSISRKIFMAEFDFPNEHCVA